MKRDDVGRLDRFAFAGLEFLVNQPGVCRFDFEFLLNLRHLPRRVVAQHLVDGLLGGLERLGLFALPDDFDALNSHLLDRLVGFAGANAGNLVDHVQPLDHLAEHRVVAGAGVAEIQPWRRGVGDKKLAPVGVLAGVGHREDARPVMLEVGVKLIRQPVAGVAGAVAQGAAALDHEVLDHAMKNQPVVVRLALGIDRLLRVVLVVKLGAFREADKVGNDDRHFFILEPRRHRANVGGDLRIKPVRQYIARGIDLDPKKIGCSSRGQLVFPVERFFAGCRLAKRGPFPEIARALNIQHGAIHGIADP